MERIAVMWPRKQLDIDWSDFAFGAWCVFSSRRGPEDGRVVPNDWMGPQEVLVSLSVRTGLDLLLTALKLPPGSEIIMSAVTIPDMVRIIGQHDLVAVPVDLESDRLEPLVEDVAQSITPRTRAILVAHLFGARVDMGPIIQLAQQHNLLVIEDCAQAFIGSSYAGHPDSDCSLFSFGPIKTATALGGAVLRVRDPMLRAQMGQLQCAYPLQSRWFYFTKLAKYALFRLLLTPRLFGVLVRAYRALGIDYDRAFGNATHSFGTTDFFDKIRRRPCTPLVRLVQRRLAMFAGRGERRLGRRTGRGDQLAASLPPGMVVGGQNYSHTFWVMPIRVENAREVLGALGSAGFDATGRSSLIVVPPPAGSSRADAAHAPWLEETIFLPNGDHMPDDAWERMATIVAEVARLVVLEETPKVALPCPATVP
jgi:dTDP-4-amino-4,6-dideoxygalactose transaminase